MKQVSIKYSFVKLTTNDIIRYIFELASNKKRVKLQLTSDRYPV